MSSSVYVAKAESENDQDKERKVKLNNSWKTFRVKQHFVEEAFTRFDAWLEESDETPSFWWRKKSGTRVSITLRFTYIHWHLLRWLWHQYIMHLVLPPPGGCFRLFDYGWLHGGLTLRNSYFDPNYLLLKCQGGKEMKSMKKISTNIEQIIIMLIIGIFFFILPAFTFLNAHFSKYQPSLAIHLLDKLWYVYNNVSSYDPV